MTDLEKATYYIVGYCDGNLAAIGLSDPFGDGTTDEVSIEPEETARLLAAMRLRVREQYPSLSEADVETAYNAASLNTIAHVPSPARRAELHGKSPR
ncbi:hypothetical protein [Mesorhizobium sp. M1378]|uniref:hypothetical protein n=1 Tax=Mesorhizobium sp. M1378 TaxID=2957092 RepID=UPI00333CB6EC